MTLFGIATCIIVECLLDFKLSPCCECCMLFFCVIPQGPNFVCRRFRTLCLFHLHRRINMKESYPPMKMEQTECSETDVHVTVHGVKFLIIKPNRFNNFSDLFLEWNSVCFWQFLCPSSGVFHCTQQWYMSYRFAGSLWTGSGWNCVSSWSCSQAVSKSVWHIPLLRV